MAKNKQNIKEQQEVPQNEELSVENENLDEMKNETNVVTEEKSKETTENAEGNLDSEKAEDQDISSEKTDKESELLTEADELAKMSMQLADIKDKYIRLSAEFDNYRKRTLKEKMDLTKTAGENIMLTILPVVDNFERALSSIDESKDIEAVKTGIKLIYSSFSEFLKQQGVNEIEALNQEFNTDEHEALTKIPSPEPELKGKVIDVIEKGYKLHDKVMRFSKVVVGE